jgi:hypothetical protein
MHVAVIWSRDRLVHFRKLRSTWRLHHHRSSSSMKVKPCSPLLFKSSPACLNLRERNPISPGSDSSEINSTSLSERVSAPPIHKASRPTSTFRKAA